MSKDYGGQAYDSPFISAPILPLQAHIDLTTLQGTDYVDEYGIVKPGTPLVYNRTAGTFTVVSGAGETAFGVVAFPEHAANGDTTTDLQGDVMVTAFAGGTLNVALAEDQLGRSYTGNEQTALDNAKNIVLV